MLNILKINQSKDFYRYVQEHNLIDPIVVCPNPTIADQVRSQFLKMSSSVESVTIAKFIRDQLMSLEVEELSQRYRGKSELMVILGAIWAKLGKEKDYKKFKKAFNLFTEIRSFSLSEQVLAAVLENYDEELGETVIWIHRFIDQLNIIDEHSSYFLLSEMLRGQELPVDYPKERIIIFYNFEFLTGSQVDLLRSLSLRDHLYIPIFKNVYEGCTSLDWPSWFDQHNTQVIEAGQSFSLPEELPTFFYPKGYLNKFLHTLSLKDQALVLGSKDINRSMLQEVPNRLIKYKAPLDIYSTQFLAVTKEIEEKLKLSSIPIHEIRDFLQAEVKQGILDKKFLKIKCILLLLNKINYWAELSDDNIEITHFEFLLLKEATSLDLPRLNLTNLKGQFEGELYHLGQIENINHQQSLMVFSSHYQGVSMGGSRYTENVEQYLGAIGPLRRSEFDLEILKAKFHEYIHTNTVSLVLEEGLLEHDLALNNMLESFHLKNVPHALTFSKTQYQFSSWQGEYQLKRLSASKLQKFLDCQLKFYLQYGQRINPLIEYQTETSPIDMGVIEHEVIEVYFSHLPQGEFDAELHQKVCIEVFQKHAQQKSYDQLETEVGLLEVRTYTAQVIKFLIALQSHYGLTYQFEKSIQLEKEGIQYEGMIDCFAEADTKVFILDFKRSNASFRTFKMIEEFEQIQLWFYLSRIQELGLASNKEIVIGYIDLSNIENTTFFGFDEDSLKDLKQAMSLSKVKYLGELDEKLKHYADIEHKAIQSINSLKEFVAMPSDIKVCHFCGINKICAREEASDASS
ncbi:MAG: hypothetical protein CME62_08340 [Halobacteriovoraceae bacterium]|nr:hypothetical protein [Halobacteriovoraceae bacterium]|tara:strand:+ start:3678 stop:6071 length:2394 start_codon:yes stop_codon:yes gene_type:complete